MNLTMAYLGHSGVRTEAGARVLSLAPNLARDRVAFDAPLKRPVQFREAISTLHDLVINDLRFTPRDKSGYEEWKKDQRRQELQLRQEAFKRAKDEVLARRETAVPRDTESKYRKSLRGWRSLRDRLV